MDDAELVLQVLQGNLGAYVHLVTRYTAQIAALCRAHITRPDAVEDLVQETFLRGFDGLAGLRDAAKFGYWLYSIARRLCADWLNDPHNEHISLDVAPASLVAGLAVEEDDPPDRTADVRRCVRQLPTKLREVVEIYYAGGRVTYKELAERLGVSFGQVNKLLTKARKLLRQCLERDDPNTSAST